MVKPRFVQDHASAIFQRHELAYREVLSTRVGGGLGADIADGANADDAARPLRSDPCSHPLHAALAIGRPFGIAVVDEDHELACPVW
jgi:hypothetical protein